MKIKHIALMGAALLAASAFMSCTQEPMMKIPAEEAYARAFIRQFGLIDPAQDWNLAQEGTVTVNVPGHANSVKVYAKVGESYYMVADLVNIEGSITIPVDIPETTNDLMVKVDGRKYYTTNGGTVTAGSRAVTIPTSTVAVESDYNNVFNANQMAPLTSPDVWEDYYSVSGESWRYNTKGATGYIPEKKDNTVHQSIKQDFVVEYTEPFIIYPMYWQTSRTHTIGIYFIDENGNALDADGNVAQSVDNIYKIPVYTSKKTGDIQVYMRNMTFSQDMDPLNWNSFISNLQKYDDSLSLEFFNDISASDVQSVEWTTSNSSVISITSNPSNNQSCRLHAVSNGYAKITATATMNNDVTHTYYRVIKVDWITGGGGSSEPGEDPESYEYKASGGSGFPSSSNWPFYEEVEDEWGNKSYLTTVDETKRAGLISDFNGYYKTGATIYLYSGSNWTPASAPDHNKYSITNIEEGENCSSGNMSLVITFTLDQTTPSTGGEEGEGEVNTDPTVDPLANLIPCKLVEEDGVWKDINFGTYNKYYSSNSDSNYEAYYPEKEVLLRSKGISVDLGDYKGYFGMYTDCGYNYPIFSQSALNKVHSSTGEDAESYAASYEHPVSQRVFFSFEDWKYSDTSDKDLNDIVFRFSNVTLTHINTTEEVKNNTEDTTTLTWLIAAEDLGTTDDFDFNDVVFTLTSVTTNKSTTTTTTTTTSQGGQVTSQEGTTSTTTEIHKEVKVQALAAGGTLPVWLHYSDGTNDYILGPNKVVLNDGNVSDVDKDACEWHQWFGKASSDMVNTGRGAPVAKPACLTIGYSKDTTNPVSHEGSWLISAFGAEEFSMARYSQTLKNGTVEGFYITVNGISGDMAELGGDTTSDITKNSYTIGAAKTGATPQMFLIPDEGNNGTWHWPSERYHIRECYPDFKTWVENAETGKEWHKAAPEASVFRVNP